MKKLSLKVAKLKNLSTDKQIPKAQTPHIGGGTGVVKDPITDNCTKICTSACSWRGCN
ncbi:MULTISPECIES: hypothetical protein [Pseudoalteromonas]|uniref:hypothetical protein n=1 Tax=Pseudoalteromonas TaxID=53246 RepID=UPI000B05594D|nr:MULTISPECIES: hypothetical protein [Pseudoalteromonas]MBE0373624.1 hypothetical protein [Pseudoalteromonas flavipulchra NCIMB 2033 = ATCC BAA-314]QUI64159.1 hypothetical protein GSF04_17375 [Pseudoalteromonas sp. A22]